MQSKLRQMRRKENDIGEYERQRRIKMQMQQYNQDINYSQAKFFSQCEQQFKIIAIDAKRQQKALKERQKIRKVKQAQQQQVNQNEVSEMLMVNIIVDFLRSNNMNYTYSVITRQKNIISQDIATKSQLASLLNLTQQLQTDHRFNVSLLQLVLNKLSYFNQQLNNKILSTNQLSVQCELLTNNNQHNNILLTQIKLEEIRNQTQKRQKKHFQNQLHLFKSQELLTLKSDMNKLYQTKEQQLSKKYQQKIQSLIQQNKQQLPHQKHTKKLQQYLNQINKLKDQLRSIKQKNIKLERQKLEHDCFQNQQIKTKIQQIQTQRKQLSQLKSEFQLALRNMGTKVQDLALQKQHIMTHNKRQTEEYLNKMRTYKQNKDYMIEKVYSTLKSFQLRIDHLSADNNKLYQENQLLRNQISSLKVKDQQNKKLEDTKRHLSISDLKVPTKNASIGVTPQQLIQHPQLQQSKVQSEQSVLTQTSQEFQQRIKQKHQHNQKINQLKLQMNLLKNKVKYLVMDFE